MRLSDPARAGGSLPRLVRLLAPGAVIFLAFSGGAGASPLCTTPPPLAAIRAPLVHSGNRLARRTALTILAIGSSSTAGTGASAPEHSYPSRLQQELEARFPDTEIHVANAGIGGQDVPEELSRLARDIAADRPQLVLWQVGTNAVLRRDNVGADERLIERGVALVKARDIDLVLMDLQWAPRVLARRSYPRMEKAIAEIAARSRIGLFRRFAIMRYWGESGQFAPAELVGSDELHMTDSSYFCLARVLAGALAAEWRASIPMASRAETRQSR